MTRVFTFRFETTSKVKADTGKVGCEQTDVVFTLGAKQVKYRSIAFDSKDESAITQLVKEFIGTQSTANTYSNNVSKYVDSLHLVGNYSPMGYPEMIQNLKN